MKKYSKVELNVLKFDVEDVIMESGVTTPVVDNYTATADYSQLSESEIVLSATKGLND